MWGTKTLPLDHCNKHYLVASLASDGSSNITYLVLQTQELDIFKNEPRIFWSFSTGQ